MLNYFAPCSAWLCRHADWSLFEAYGVPLSRLETLTNPNIFDWTLHLWLVNILPLFNIRATWLLLHIARNMVPYASLDSYIGPCSVYKCRKQRNISAEFDSVSMMMQAAFPNLFWLICSWLQHMNLAMVSQYHSLWFYRPAMCLLGNTHRHGTKNKCTLVFTLVGC